MGGGGEGGNLLDTLIAKEELLQQRGKLSSREEPTFSLDLWMSSLYTFSTHWKLKLIYLL